MLQILTNYFDMPLNQWHRTFQCSRIKYFCEEKKQTSNRNNTNNQLGDCVRTNVLNHFPSRNYAKVRNLWQVEIVSVLCNVNIDLQSICDTWSCIHLANLWEVVTGLEINLQYKTIVAIKCMCNVNHFFSCFMF